MRIFCLPIFLCFFFYAANSQQLYFNHLSVNNGLTQGVNNCVFKDSRGFVWISSFDGLNRFDGLDCKKFYSSPKEEEGIKGTLFLNILEDKNGDLWIGSNAGLNVYNRKADSFTCFRIDVLALGDQFCSPFYVDDKNGIWVQSGSGIFIFDPVTKKFNQLDSEVSGSSLIIKTIPQQLYRPVKKLLVISNTSPALFMGTITNKNIAWKQHPLSFRHSIKAMLAMDDENYWLGTDKGLYHLHATANGIIEEKNLLAGDVNISSLHLDKANVLWIGSFDKGLFKLNPFSKSIQQYSTIENNSYAISGNRIVNVYTDDNRNLWVSVWGKGIDYTNLDKFHFNQFITRGQAAAAGTDNFIRSVISINNEIWCATQSGGIIVLDSSKQIKQVIKSLPLSAEHLSVVNDKVWIATFNGLFMADAGTKKITKINFSDTTFINPKSLQFNYIHPLAGSDVMVSSNAGLFIVRNKKQQYRLIAVKGISSSDVYLTTYIDANNKIYVSKAFKGFGIYKLQNDSLISLKQFPLQASIKCFSEERDTLLWAGSTIGLIKINKKSLSISKIFTTSDGLNNQYVYGVIPDKKYLWLSTNAGISRFNTADNSIKFFSTADGLQSNEYNTYAFCKTGNGELLFAGVNGLNSFYPSQLKPFTTAPRLTLNAIQVNDTLYRSAINYAELKSLQLSHDQNTLGFQFTVIDHVDAAATRISYMLQGYDKNWVDVANKTLIRYVKLPPGNYTLKVKAFNADGVMTKEIYQLSIAVATPWWQSWWFRTLMIAAAIALVIAAVKTYFYRKFQRQQIQLEKELAVEQERIRMARELHDGLGSMLSGIKHSFSAIKNKINISGELEHKFDHSIEKLDDSIKDIRAVSHTMFSAEFLQDGLDAAVKNYCNAISAGGKVNIVFESILQQQPVLTGEIAFHIFRVVQELVQNVIRHSAATEAIVQLSYNEGMLSLTVEDNGKGFDTHLSKQQKGIGLKNVESRIKSLHGKTDIQSAPGKGTSVFIEVPVR